MSAHEEAVQVVAVGLCQADDFIHRIGGPAVPPCGYHRDKAIPLVRAIATSPEVRAALVRALLAHKGDWFIEQTDATSPTTGELMPAMRPWPLADCVLAALGGTDG